MEEKIAALTRAMLTYETGFPHRAQHFLKVWAYARNIAQAEEVPEEQRFLIEAAALVHDIGIRPSLEKYGSGAGPYQEKEGPAPARALLEALGFPPELTERVAYLVGHHHSYASMDGADYQILVEADFLVNLLEGGASPEAIADAEAKIFRTKAGKTFLRAQFPLPL